MSRAWAGATRRPLHMGYWGHQRALGHDLQSWQDSVRLACRWMIDRSLITTVRPDFVESTFEHLDKFADWRGAFRGEYAASTRKWDAFCPAWHGGQAVKALALAYSVLGEDSYLEAARAGADFILRHQITDPSDPDFGLILAYEAGSDGINTSAILESLGGLFTLSEVSGEARYAEAALAALRWTKARMFLPDEGLFLDDFDVAHRTARPARWMSSERFPQPARPLLDDGAFLVGYELSGDGSLRDVALRTADRLLADEAPEGNWQSYPPADPVTGTIHPRHAYWWGRPMWMVHRATGDARYLDCCRRSARWYVHAMRTDGGLFRNTGPGFITPSFGHAMSGIACAAILWSDLVREYGDTEWREPIRRALNFCRSLQFVHAADENLQGAILEKALPPDGTDAPQWYLRDIGTFFYVQAVCGVLRDIPDLVGV